MIAEDADAAVDCTGNVDPFLGIEATALPEPQGIARRWGSPKALVGNTHPGACYPLGMVSVCPYTGGYPTGYSLYKPSYWTFPEPFLPDYEVSGFTHFQQSGTGAIGLYYNYFKVIPLAGGSEHADGTWLLRNQTAEPGYYSAELGTTGIRAELTVSRKCALHRYTFPKSDRARIVMDLTSGGLSVIRDECFPSEVGGEVLSDNSVQGRIVAAGLAIYFFAEVEARGWKSAFSADHVTFEGPGDGASGVVLRIGFSLRSVEQARANLQEVAGQSFDDVRASTKHKWAEYLSRIEVDGGTPDQRTIFYSALYHSLIKPSDFSNEGPFDGPFFLDFATLWDQYKTQLPLINCVYPERASNVVNSLLSLAERCGALPISALMMKDFVDRESDAQAAALAHVVIADAFAKGVAGVDWRRAARVMAAEFESGRGKKFAETGRADQPTHTLDLAYGAFCTAVIARGVGDEPLYRRMMSLAANWRKEHDLTTGRLPEGDYYEGGSWNYSFRLLHDMAARISLYDSEKAYCADLDAFFGIAEPPEHPWEGLNNEPDMECPYAYIYAGRPDRTAEVVRATMQYRFATGKGGLPGNDDSGGTSSWYVWSALGLFPVAGQDVFLVGSPIFERARIKLARGTLVVEARGVSDDGICVQSAVLNGEPLDRAWLRWSEIADGGELVLEMGPASSRWGWDSRPPSFPS